MISKKLSPYKKVYKKVVPYFLSCFAAYVVALSLSAKADLSFETVTMKVGGKPVKVKLADDENKRAQGLMHIPSLGTNEGMLFIFEHEQTLSFWMKNTLIPLAIGFFDRNAELVDVKEMQTASSIMDVDPPSFQSAKPALFALEMNKGWFEKNGLKPDAKNPVKLELVSTTKCKLLRGKAPLRSTIVSLEALPGLSLPVTMVGAGAKLFSFVLRCVM